MALEPGPGSFRLGAVSTLSRDRPARRPVPIRWVVRALGIVVLGAAVVTACSPTGVTRSAAPGSLDGTSWTAVLVAGQPTVAGQEPTATFKNGVVQGSTGCNRYSGPYTQSGGDIDFGDLMSTLMGCIGPVGDVETRFNAALHGATSVSMDATGRLIVDGTGGAITFEVAAQPS